MATIRWKRRIQKFSIFLFNCEEGNPSNSEGVHMNDILKVEGLLQLNTFQNDFDFVDGELIGDLACRGIQKYDKIVKLLRYKNHS